MSDPADINDRLEAAATKAEDGSDIIYRFSNDPLSADPIPTESGPIKNLKQVSDEIATNAQEMVEQAIEDSMTELNDAVTASSEAADRAQSSADAAAAVTNPFPTVAEGLTATSGSGATNRFFSVPGTGTTLTALYRNDAGSATSIGAILNALSDAVTINKGKAFPLRSMNRGGVTSAASATLNNLILDVKVIGDEAAIEGKYFRIGYFQNDATIGSNADQGIVIEQFDAATYAASGTATIINNHTDAPASIVRTGGVQTFVIVPPGAPFLRFVITIDAAALPAAGTPINALVSGNAAYSWIIDPACYHRIAGMGSTITINSGRIAPFRNTSRGGSVSTPSVLQTNVILNARVINAKRGKYYGLRYFQNGNAAVVPAADGWIIEEVDIAGYDASTITTANSISALADAQPAIDRTLGIQTVLLNTKTDVRVEVTLDASKLQAYGTQYAMNASFQNGYSQVIDPACYEFPVSTGGTPSRVSYSLASTGILTLSWSDGVGTRGFVFGPNGANNLPNFMQVIKDGGVISSFGTDWLPPMIFDAKANGDGWPNLEFTGGNHLVDSKMTAANIAYVVEADGVPLTGTASGTADRITCRIINKLMAGNTVSLSRYPLLQSFQVDFMPGVVGVHADIMALEDLQIYTDYACQIVTTGANDTMFYLNGQFPNPIPFDGTVNSGPADTYPDAWAVLTASANGQLAAWIDRKYGVAAENYIYPPYGKIIGGGSASTKQYTTAIHTFTQRGSVVSPPKELAAGQSYQWRGGYSWGPVNLPEGMVATLRYMDEWRIRRAFALSASRIIKP